MATMRNMALLALCCFAANAAAKRQLLQEYVLIKSNEVQMPELPNPSAVPAFQGVNLTLTNADDPAATETTQVPPVQQSTSGQAVVPDPAVAVPTPAQTVRNLVLPSQVTAQTPAQAPATQPPLSQTPVLPTAPAPQPTVQQSLPPVSRALAPSPVQALPMQPPVISVPAPAPAGLPVAKAPAPVPKAAAPVPAPVPAPAPEQPPQCGVQPQCRLFVEDMLCCDSAGVVNSKQHMVMRLQCTHPVNYYSKCVSVRGPTNMSAFTQFETAAWSRSHAVQVNFLDEFFGNATIDVEGPRKDANLSADCGLYITPCLLNGSLVSEVSPVKSLSFTTLGADAFLEVSSSVSDDVNNLDSLVMPNLFFPSACQQQDIGNLSANFFAKDWVSYASGFQNTCNYTAFLDAAAAQTPAVQFSSGDVSTASLG